MKTIPLFAHALGQLYAADTSEVAAVFVSEPFLSNFSPISDLEDLGIGDKIRMEKAITAK